MRSAEQKDERHGVVTDPSTERKPSCQHAWGIPRLTCPKHRRQSVNGRAVPAAPGDLFTNVEIVNTRKTRLLSCIQRFTETHQNFYRTAVMTNDKSKPEQTPSLADLPFVIFHWLLVICH